MNETWIVCPYCETENPAMARTCAQCGESLIRVCPRCNTINPVTAENCIACEQHFDALGQIMARHEIRNADRFTRQAAGAIDVKGQDRAQDKARSNQLWETERQRQALLAEQKHRQKAQEQRLIAGAVVFAIMVVAAIILLSISR